jgi:hypothetical protein
MLTLRPFSCSLQTAICGSATKRSRPVCQHLESLQVLSCVQGHQKHLHTVKSGLFFLGGRRGTRTPKHFVNLTEESKNFKIF